MAIDSRQAGAVYQATNWLYLGQGLNGGKAASSGCSCCAGKDNEPAHWQTTRTLRRRSHRSVAEARALGWQIAKRRLSVYALNVGRDRSTGGTMPAKRISRARN
jgi:hypothetical protein